ncbi:MAG TPA: FkbM family methyltransferase [Steroidobacteraceae bacterium]|jgi:FkbM family methyltransferase|nr:FkbM family methyltransferase [Steroidobacteraceae bacterium]
MAIVALKNHPRLSIEVHATPDKFISSQIVETGEWEPFETHLVECFLRPGDVFVDIGANIGWYTIIAASIVGNNGYVYAFEPGTANFELAARNLVLNDLQNVTLEQIAIADRTGTGRLFLSRENLGDHRLFAAEEERCSQTVSVTSLGRYFEHNPTPIRMLKIDAQGSEARIFEGLPDDFARTRKVAAILLEFWPYALEQSGSSAKSLVRSLAAQGMSCYIIHECFRGLDPIDLDVLEQRAYGDLRENNLFLNLLALPATNAVPAAIRTMIRPPDAFLFYHAAR